MNLRYITQEDVAMKRISSILSLCGVVLLQACQGFPMKVDTTVFTPPGAAEPAPAKPPVSMVSPMMEKRETFVATGYSVISVQNSKNPSQQRLLAIRASKLDAYRSLTEQVYGQQLDATTTVADMTVISDNFRARDEGVVYGAQLVSITPVGEDTYETTLSLDRQVVMDLRALYLSQLAQRGR